MTHNDALAAILGPDIFARLEWSLLNDVQRAAILSVFRVGMNAGVQSGTVATIDSVLAEGRVMICEDGSQWEAPDAADAEMVEDWGEGALIAIHRGLAYRLDPYEAVEVEALSL